LKHYNDSKEFGSSRGAIHSHMAAITESSADQKIDEIMGDWAIAAMEASILHDSNTHDASRNESNADQDSVNTAKKIFDEALANAKQMASQKLHDVFSKHFGTSAVHIGHVPTEYLMPGGRSDMGYRSSFMNMQTHRDVLDKNEVCHAKFEREEHLYDRRVNLQNQCWTHCCSDYCLRMKGIARVPFDRRYHREEDSYLDDHGRKMAKVVIYECRFGFGRKQRYDPSGQGNLTEDIPFNNHPHVELDTNQQPRYISYRNHPRVLQQPVSVWHWGCNSDMQRLLTNTTTYNRVQASSNQYSYKDFI
jgi:hypothetical protein